MAMALMLGGKEKAQWGWELVPGKMLDEELESK
jgi:hypothetical protein